MQHDDDHKLVTMRLAALTTGYGPAPRTFGDDPVTEARRFAATEPPPLNKAAERRKLEDHVLINKAMENRLNKPHVPLFRSKAQRPRNWTT